VRTDQRWDEGVGDGGGQPGSSARARRSQAAANPAIAFKSTLGGRLEATQEGGGSVNPCTRGMA
jgi:putative hemolysin